MASITRFFLQSTIWLRSRGFYFFEILKSSTLHFALDLAETETGRRWYFLRYMSFSYRIS